MRSRLLSATLAGAALAAAVMPAAAPAQTGIVSAMTCVGPTDAAGLDAILARAGSPLAGQGATFVAEGTAAGVDPRALVAIAAHETMLETYVPAQSIHNPFGLGPGMDFAGEADAIAYAARNLGANYLPEGRTTLATIGAKWAPVGAANDPSGLNANWTAGVGAYFAALGGDPELPVTTQAQPAVPSCAGAPALAPAVPSSTPTGPPVVTAWGGAAPAGRDPATIDGFVFPLALAPGAPAVYRDSFAEPGPVDCGAARLQCAVTIATAPGADAVAMAAGTLHRATPAEAEGGIAFWLVTPSGDRLGYGPLQAYADGIGEGATVAAGRPLGTTAGWVRVAWERGGARIDPYPLLAVTRPSDGA